MRIAFFRMAALGAALLAWPVAAEDTRPAAEAPGGEANEPKPEKPDTKAPATLDHDALDAELSHILDELVEARARAAFLGKRLFDTQLSISVSRSGGAQALTHLRVSLDGAPIHESDGQALARGDARIFEGAVAEGMHELRVEISEHAQADAAFESVRSERFKLKVRRKQRTEVALILKDRSDLAEETAEGDDGEIDISTRVRVKSRDVKKP